MILIVAASIFSALLITIQVRNYTVFKLFVDEFEKSNKTKLEKTKCSALFYIVRIVTLIIAVVFVMIVAMPAENMENGFLFWTMSVGEVLICVMLTDLLFGRYLQCTYYNKDGFIIDKSFVRFSNIKEMSSDGKAIYLKNGKMIHADKKKIKEILTLKESIHA